MSTWNIGLTILSLACVVSSGIIELNDQSFYPFLSSSKLTLVKFYSPWCHYCKIMAPDFQRAANSNSAANFAQVNCEDQGKGICRYHSINGLPALMAFRNDKVVGKYVGYSTHEEVVDFLNKQTIGASTK